MPTNGQPQAPLLPQATWITLGLGLLMCIAFGKIRYTDDSGMPDEIFRRSKVRWQHEADIVILGDSRAYIGLSPDHMKQAWGRDDLRILNFGFNAQGYHHRYLNFTAAVDRTNDHGEPVQAVMDPASTEKRIIVCLTARSLTPRSMVENGFDFAYRKDRSMSRLDRALEPIEVFCTPMELKDLTYGLCPWAKKKHFYREFFANGWMASDRIPRKTGSGLQEYRDTVFVNNFVDETIVQRVMDYVRKWRRHGIRVYGLRPPTCKPMIEMENDLGRYDEEDISRRFEAVGGIWLNINQVAYETFDDSHLTRAAAVRFSKDVVDLIRKHEASH